MSYKDTNAYKAMYELWDIQNQELCPAPLLTDDLMEQYLDRLRDIHEKYLNPIIEEVGINTMVAMILDFHAAELQGPANAPAAEEYEQPRHDPPAPATVNTAPSADTTMTDAGYTNIPPGAPSGRRPSTAAAQQKIGVADKIDALAHSQVVTLRSATPKAPDAKHGDRDTAKKTQTSAGPPAVKSPDTDTDSSSSEDSDGDESESDESDGDESDGDNGSDSDYVDGD